jgi:hypothetical protein
LVAVVGFVGLVCELDDLWDLVWEEDQGAREDLVLLLVALKCEECYYAEVLTAAAHYPEEVSVGGL